MKNLNILERFLSKIEPTTDGGCWIWDGCINKNEYGLFNVSGHSRLAHRVAWELFVGPVPVGKCVLHRCDNPWCVRPSHLFVGSQADNIKDMIGKRRHVSHQRVGYMPTGEAHHYFKAGPKLTREQANKIRCATGSHVSIAKRFGISQSMVSRIKSGIHWK